MVKDLMELQLELLKCWNKKIEKYKPLHCPKCGSQNIIVEIIPEYEDTVKDNIAYFSVIYNIVCNDCGGKFQIKSEEVNFLPIFE